MYAVFVEVNADESHVPAARESLKGASAQARQGGAKGEYWLAPVGGRGVAVVVFDTEEEARNVVNMMPAVGQPPAPDAPAGVTLKTVEVLEVLASVT